MKAQLHLRGNVQGPRCSPFLPHRQCLHSLGTWHAHRHCCPRACIHTVFLGAPGFPGWGAAPWSRVSVPPHWLRINQGLRYLWVWVRAISQHVDRPACMCSSHFLLSCSFLFLRCLITKVEILVCLLSTTAPKRFLLAFCLFSFSNYSLHCSYDDFFKTQAGSVSLLQIKRCKEPIWWGQKTLHVLASLDSETQKFYRDVFQVSHILHFHCLHFI